MRDRIFISYSRADSAYLDELRAHMSALPDADRLAVWADTGIAPSEHWRQEIDEALTTAAAAVVADVQLHRTILDLLGRPGTRSHRYPRRRSARLGQEVGLRVKVRWVTPLGAETASMS